jgi:hypothetical protein
MMWMHLILGELDGFSYAIDGATVEFIIVGKSKIAVAIEGERVRIEITVNLSALGEKGALEPEDVADLLAAEIAGTIAYCQSVPVDPFGFSEIAARAFLTRGEWKRYNWLERFQAADVQVNVNIISLGS